MSERVGTPGLIVNAIQVYVTNYFGWSGDLVIGHAESRIRESVIRVSGYALASQIEVDPGIESGRQSVVYTCGARGPVARC